MEILDLHRVRHKDAKRMIDRLANSYYMGTVKRPIKIITGHSQKMLNLVTEILNEYQIDYKIGDYLSINKTFIIIP